MPGVRGPPIVGRTGEKRSLRNSGAAISGDDWGESSQGARCLVAVAGVALAAPGAAAAPSLRWRCWVCGVAWTR